MPMAAMAFNHRSGSCCARLINTIFGRHAFLLHVGLSRAAISSRSKTSSASRTPTPSSRPKQLRNLTVASALCCERSKQRSSSTSPTTFSPFALNCTPSRWPLTVGPIFNPGSLPNSLDKAVEIVRRFSATPAVSAELAKLLFW